MMNAKVNRIRGAKRLACFVILCLALPARAQTNQPSPPAASVTLSWASVPGAVSYAVWQGTNSGAYTWATNVGTNLSLTLTNLTRGVTNYWAVNAQATDGAAGPFSGEAQGCAQEIPSAPGRIITIWTVP